MIATNLTRRFAVLPVAGLLALGLAACGDDDSSSSDKPKTEAKAPAANAKVALAGDRTVLVLDPGTGKVLTDNKVTVAPVAPAKADGKGIGFPITGGKVTTKPVNGTIEHSGGLKFSAGGKELEVTDFVVDTEAGTLTAQAGGAAVPLLALDPSKIKQANEGGAIVVSGISGSLTPEAAKALNDTFGVSLFKEGLKIGDVTVYAKAA